MGLSFSCVLTSSTLSEHSTTSYSPRLPPVIESGSEPEVRKMIVTVRKRRAKTYPVDTVSTTLPPPPMLPSVHHSHSLVSTSPILISIHKSSFS